MPSLTDAQVRARTIRLKKAFPDTDGRPQAYCVHLDGVDAGDAAPHRGVLIPTGLAPGSRVYVDIGPWGAEDYVPCEVLPRPGMAYVVHVRRV